MEEKNYLDPDKYDYLNYEPLTFKDKDGEMITMYQVPVYYDDGELITVIIGTYEMLDNLIDFYTRAAMYDGQPKEICLKIAATLQQEVDDLTE